LGGLTRNDRSKEVPKLILWRKKRRLFFVIVIVYHVSEHMSSVFQYKVNDTSKNKYNLQEALSYSPKWRLQAISTDGVESILKPLPHCRYIRLLSDSLMRLISVKWR